MREVDAFGLLLLEIPIAIALTLVAVRLLGVRRSWVAIAAAGVIGWVTANLVELLLREWDWDGAQLSVRLVAFMLLFTMLAAVGIDFVALARHARAG